MESQLRTKFLQFIKNASKIEDTSTKFNGIEVTWSSKLNAWKIDMTSSVSEFLDKNPDIKAKVQTKYPNLDLNNLNVRDVVGRKKGIRGVGIEALNQLAQATDNPTDSTAFIGSTTRSQGNARGSNKANKYIEFGQEQNKGLPKGGQRWTSLDDGSGVIRNPSRIINTNKQQIMGIKKKTPEFNFNNLQDSELFREVEKWLTDNPGKNLRDFRKETGYDGQALKTRHRKSEPIRVSFKDTEKANLTQAKRLNRIQPKTDAEATYVKDIQNQARVQSDDLVHQITYGGRKSVAEHNLRGDNEAMSISDPNFAGRKTELETRALKKGYLTGLDNVTGELVVAPEGTFNKHDPGSSIGARVISEGEDIATVIGKLPTNAEAVKQLGNAATNNFVTRALGIGPDAKLASMVENMTDLAKGIPPGARFGMSLIPGLGIAGDAADAAVKHQERLDNPTLLNKAQDWVAKSVAATSVIPTPSAQAYNFAAGLGLGVSDAIEHYGEEIGRHIGYTQDRLKEKFRRNFTPTKKERFIDRTRRDIELANKYSKPKTDDDTDEPTKTN